MLRLLFIALLGLLHLDAHALVLDDARGRVAAWPEVRVLLEGEQALTLQEAIEAAPRFTAPTGAYATLGLRKEGVWLRVPLEVAPSSDGRWVLDVDYPVLNQVDVYLLAADGRLLQQVRMGNLVPFSQRPLASRTHALVLELAPGSRAELLMRVQTKGGTILPVTLAKPPAFHQQALSEQMLQGLFNGLGLALLLYSLMQWVTMREHLFIKYALLITGSLVFSVFQFGIGAQYLWTDNVWAELHAGGLSALLASTGTFLFVEHVLRGEGSSRWFGNVMRAGAAVLMLTAVAYAFDWIHVHTVSTVVGTLGLAPAVLGMPGAVSRAWRGDKVGWYFLAAWTGYFVTTAVMVGLIKGRVGVSWWSMHSFQIGATLDMLLFMRVIGLRLHAVHTAAQHAAHERDRLMSMAHTDALTGLPNRRGLDVALAAELPHCTRERLLAVYMLDLDGFKDVNDRHGHDVGDELLVAVARRLQNCLRTSDVVARLGGDEFVVTVSGLHDDRQAQEIGTHLLEAFSQPFALSQGRTCEVGLTIGYALVPLDGRDPVALLKRADEAMYAGKQGGKRCVRRAAEVMAAAAA